MNRIIQQSITIIKFKSITIINLNNEFSNVLYNEVPFSISFNYVNVPPTPVDFFAAAKNVNQTNIIAPLITTHQCSKHTPKEP